MSSIRAALFEWNATRLLTVSVAALAVYVSRSLVDDTALQLLLVLFLAALFAGVATYVTNVVVE